MARYCKLLGRRIEVQYRAGDVFLPATGILVADSGKSIFLEEHFEQQGQVKSFRWEIRVSVHYAPRGKCGCPRQSARCGATRFRPGADGTASSTDEEPSRRSLIPKNLSEGYPTITAWGNFWRAYRAPLEWEDATFRGERLSARNL